MSSSNCSFIKKRKSSPAILGGLTWFTRGDVVSLNYSMSGMGFVFTGLCITVRKKSMMSANTSFGLRNILAKVAVELFASLYSLCRVSYKLLDYSSKRVYYKSAKLYYLRKKPNSESWIKE